VPGKAGRGPEGSTSPQRRAGTSAFAAFSWRQPAGGVASWRGPIAVSAWACVPPVAVPEVRGGPPPRRQRDHGRSHPSRHPSGHVPLHLRPVLLGRPPCLPGLLPPSPRTCRPAPDCTQQVCHFRTSGAARGSSPPCSGGPAACCAAACQGGGQRGESMHDPQWETVPESHVLHSTVPSLSRE
jgi:hypothetical protein